MQLNKHPHVINAKGKAPPYSPQNITVITARKRSLRRLFLHLSVCHSVHGGGGGVPGQVHPRAGTPPGQVHPPQAGTPPPWQVHSLPGRYTPLAGTPPPPPPGSSACWEIRATSRRYASYWNAFLFI